MPANAPRVVDLHAPEVIVEMNRKMVRDAIAMLDTGDARGVLRAWPRAWRMLEQGSPANPAKPAGDKPN